MSLKPIADIGEFGLIEKIAAICAPTIKPASGVVEGIGDDCAVYEHSPSSVQVATTDILAEHQHFDLLTTPPHHLGSKAISVNVSDICAMNALPRYALISIAMPQNTPVEMVESLYNGMAHAAKLYGTALVGGDTSSSAAGIVISVTLIGETSKENLALRSGASPGDLICVTGALGGAAAGLKVLLREKRIMMDHVQNGEPYNRDIMNNLEEYTEAIQHQLLPSARVDIIEFFHKHQIVPTSMIDISDGLSSDLRHICQQSMVGARIEEGRIPILSQARHIADEFQEDALDYALGGGEDYQLLFTLKPDNFQAIVEHRDITVIGKITPKEEGMTLNDIYGMQIDMKEIRGFDHFT
ncbi:thiamine-monophosphate kinase [Prosthecochloris aestuarii DSM 271]|uniref:Thiamine-monophosphate kinase n=1 Tax=Prosthecochloris aestuarii (strain DSM 271 / SK 413) TaxID=290512 RepID=B4S4E1_PROA2|nr:thiamine-phosphate kinase [Prosthecochloris aestuarii]ACF45389.1 thiamine-monophosphate kinase [Prosthecochloris aestuarii DSM 271]